MDYLKGVCAWALVLFLIVFWLAIAKLLFGSTFDVPEALLRIFLFAFWAAIPLQWLFPIEDL